MWLSLGVLLTLVLLSSGALGQVVQWSIARRQDTRGTRRLSSSTVDGLLDNDKGRGGYFLTVEVGTPSQQLSLQLDTGSSDVWVPYSDASICHDKSNGGCLLGSFNPDVSTTFIDSGKSFDISYQDNTSSMGDYFTDNFQLGTASLQNFTMGLGVNTTVPYGLAGVGYAHDEASLGTTQTPYKNLPLALEQAELINTAAYSLWLNDLGSSSGNILFGGIDTEKYVGELTRLPILLDKRDKDYTAFAVSMYSLEAASSSGSDILTSMQSPLTVVLDSGTSLSYLPQDMASQVWEEVGAIYDTDAGAPVLPCSSANNAGHFSFVFAGPGGPRINVTMKDLVLEPADGSAPTFDSGPHRGRPVCEFGILNQTGSPYLLGDTFLRSAYVVYDLVNNEIGIAPTKFNSTDSQVIAFASHGAAIPSATSAPDQGSSAPPTQATQDGLKAAKGFQADNAAIRKTILSSPGIVAIGITLTYVLITS